MHGRARARMCKHMDALHGCATWLRYMAAGMAAGMAALHGCGNGDRNGVAVPVSCAAVLRSVLSWSATILLHDELLIAVEDDAWEVHDLIPSSRVRPRVERHPKPPSKVMLAKPAKIASNPCPRDSGVWMIVPFTVGNGHFQSLLPDSIVQVVDTVRKPNVFPFDLEQPLHRYPHSAATAAML